MTRKLVERWRALQLGRRCKDLMRCMITRLLLSRVIIEVENSGAGRGAEVEAALSSQRFRR